MIILAAAIIGIVIGLIRRGRFSGIKTVSKWPLGLIGLIILIILYYLPYFGSLPFASILPIVSFVGYLLILITLVFNLDDIWSIMLAVGITGNFVVTFINGGYMPVQEMIVAAMPQSSPVTTSILNGTSAVFMVMQQPGTLLWFLGDILPLDFLANFTVYFGSVPGLSAGTIFIAIGLIGWIQAVMVRASRKNKQIDLEKATMATSNRFRNEPKKVQPEQEDYYTGNAAQRDESFSAIDAFFAEEGETEFIPTLDADRLDEVRSRSDQAYGAQIPADSSSETKVLDFIDDTPDYLRPSADEAATDVETDGFFTQRYHDQKQYDSSMDSFFPDEDFYAQDTGEYEPIQTAPISLDTEELFPDEENRPSAEEILRDSSTTTNEERVQTAPVYVAAAEEETPQPEAEETQEESYEQSYEDDSEDYSEEEERTDTVSFEVPKPYFEDLSSEYYQKSPTPRKRYDIEDSSGYLVSKAYQEEMAKKDRSTEEMSNIWAQVTADQKNLKNSRRRQSRYSTVEANPYLDDRKRREAAEMARKEAEEQERIREQERLLAEQRRHAQRTQEIIQSANPSAEEDVIMTDEDRIKAGYEKVRFNIGDREVSFWKKKNE